jgi:hypothetical protein
MMPFLRTVVVIMCLTCVGPSLAHASDVSLTIRDGMVTLVAHDATVRQILAEWARVGKTTVVNLDRIPGGPITLELTNVPESQALGIVLRSIAGFMAAPRPLADSHLSRYDRIIVMPALATVATPASPVTLPGRAGASQQPGPRNGPAGANDQMGMGRRRSEPPTDNLDTGGGDDEPDAEQADAAQPTRPPPGVRPGFVTGQVDPPAPGGAGAAGGATQQQRPVIPGMLTPGTVVRPGQIVPAPTTPPKPPGDMTP